MTVIHDFMSVWGKFSDSLGIAAIMTGTIILFYDAGSIVRSFSDTGKHHILI